MDIDGLVTLRSTSPAPETVERAVSAIERRGVAVLARIDHGAAAARAGLELGPTVLILYGDPKAGTPLMQAAQTTGIDLPLKLLVWADAAGATWLSYNEPAYLAHRHGLDAAGLPTLAAMSGGIAAIAAEAAGTSVR